MAFQISLENAARTIRTTVRVLEPIYLLPPLARRDIERRANSSKMRLQVLWRDRYRCRSCNRKGDEITLEVHPIRPSASSVEEMIALCARCGERAARWNIKASSGAQFLERLWRAIRSAADHHPHTS